MSPPLDSPTACYRCQGRGIVYAYGHGLRVPMVCPSCAGTGLLDP